MFHVLHRFWRWLLARLGYCGGAHFLAGAPSLPPPLTPEPASYTPLTLPTSDPLLSSAPAHSF